MEQLFSQEYWFFWAVVLGVALFVPVRSLIWMMSVNRAAKKAGGTIDDDVKQRLKRKASVTAGLLCFVFAILYTYVLFFR